MWTAVFLPVGAPDPNYPDAPDLERTVTDVSVKNLRGEIDVGKEQGVAASSNKNPSQCMTDDQLVLGVEDSNVDEEFDFPIEQESVNVSCELDSRCEIEVHPPLRKIASRSKPVKRLFSQMEDSSEDDFDFSSNTVLDSRGFDFPSEAGPSHVYADNDDLQFVTRNSQASQEFDFPPESGMSNESGTVNEDAFEEDSDWEPSDDVEVTQERIRRKRLRHSKRGYGKKVILHEIEGNIEAYNEFRSYMDKTRVFTPKKRPVGISNQKRIDKLHPTIEKTLGHIFTYEDSLLNFLSMKNPDFRMKDHCSFTSPNFRTLEHQNVRTSER